MSYNISGRALKELRKLTKENPSGSFDKGEAPNLWALHPRILPNRSQ